MKNKNINKGFSLMELIVVIAILAILIAVLAPSLMTYTKRSRAQKDVTTMDEVVNAVQLAMADQDCYDEMIKYSCDNNFITYTDSSGNYGQQIIDAEYWAPDGLGRATTITFNPEKDSNGDTIYRLENAIVNDMTYGNGSVAENRVMQGAQIDNNQCYLKNASLNGSQTGYLYNRVRQSVGDSVIATSATYANSSFTIFIRFNQKDGVTVADVNGSFNGTNLTADAPASKGSGTTTYDQNTGDAITTVTTPGTTNSNFTASALQGGGSFSVTPEYVKEEIKDETPAPLVGSATFSDGVTLTWEELKLPENREKYSYGYYGDISDTEIGDNAFSSTCDSLESITIPKGITTIDDMAFNCCDNLKSITFEENSQLTTIGYDAFYACAIESLDLSRCTNLTTIGDCAFECCSSLESITLPDSVTTIDTCAFLNCNSLESITFEGTVAQWNAITFGTEWNNNISATEVVCSDGTVSLS